MFPYYNKEKSTSEDVLLRSPLDHLGDEENLQTRQQVAGSISTTRRDKWDKRHIIVSRLHFLLPCLLQG